ncbi:MAG TPA: serine/threonine-protein kinase [Candidatus Xenobia bacterium]|jgi:predicted Ser/Thr protein kinase
MPGPDCASQTPECLPPGTWLSHRAFRIDRVLGRGGFAFTYLATDVLLAREVAIKEFFPPECWRDDGRVAPGALEDDVFAAAREQFQDEARRLVRFRHAGIVTVHSLFEENNTAYMVMEYLEGRSLADGLPYPIPQALRIIEEVGKAVAAVHQAGLLHRDIKPDNIIETADRIVLIDFGTAREYLAEKTRRLTTILTPQYAPIEQYSPQGQRGPATDIYALAATFYHLVAGQPPPTATERVQGLPLCPPPVLPGELWPAIARGLAVEPEARWQRVEDFLAALALAPARIDVPEGPLAASPATRLRGHRGIVRAIALGPSLVATGAEDRTIRVWESGALVRCLDGHTGWVTAVRFVGDRLLSGSHDKTVRLWDVSRGQLLEKWEVRDHVLSLGATPDGQRVAAGLQNRSLQVWCGGQVTASQGGFPGRVVSVDFNHDGAWLAMAVSGDAKVWIVDPRGHTRATLEGHVAAVRCVAVSAVGLASGAADGAVCLWDVAQGTVRKVLGAGRREVVSLSFGAGGRWLAVGRKRQVVDVFDVVEERLVLTFEAHERELTAVALSGDGRRLLTASADETVQVWEIGPR